MNSQELKQLTAEIRDKYNRKQKIFKDDYKDFSEKYPSLYNLCISDDFDQKQLDYFLYKLSQVENKTVNQHDASVAIGGLLVDKYVKTKL